jgi:eukaryotic-like serine/threonine-protein kinase
MGLKDRLQWLARTALILFVLASVTFLSGLIAMRYAIQGREVVLPDVVGKTSKQAQQQLQGVGVGFKVEDRVYSNLPVDAVVRQSPPPATHVKAGADEHVVLSLGPQKVTIPDLVGNSERAARIELLRSDMQLGEESTAYLPGAPADTVLDQDPVPGTANATSPHENLLVSTGPPPQAYVMPELDGSTVASAEATLASAGLKVAKLTLEAAPAVQHGIVLDQVPIHGARVDATVPIELHVAE